jgi:hypothetical protein
MGSGDEGGCVFDPNDEHNPCSSVRLSIVIYRRRNVIFRIHMCSVQTEIINMGWEYIDMETLLQKTDQRSIFSYIWDKLSILLQSILDSKTFLFLAASLCCRKSHDGNVEMQISARKKTGSIPWHVPTANESHPCTGSMNLQESLSVCQSACSGL